jgi:NAD(P)-dependent dehydrogenase (short-subunit alcohol dehydrogenase family)
MSRATVIAPLTERKGSHMSTLPSKAGGQASSPQQPVRDKVIVITGASSGLGLETAKQLAGQGGEIVMIVRDQAGGEHARSQIAEIATHKPPTLLTADLSAQAHIRRVAEGAGDRYAHVDILINNGGAAFSHREQSSARTTGPRPSSTPAPLACSPPPHADAD